MEMSGEYRIAASREVVWAALNDPEILRQAIPGCDSIDKTSDTDMTAKVTAKVGPVRASFEGKVTLSDLDPPNGYRISGEGKGGPAGFAKGGANVRLEADGDGTLLKYDVDATVGGKLAQLGARLIDGTARKMAADFFARFGEIVAAQAAAGAPAAAAAPAAPIVAPDIASAPPGEAAVVAPVASEPVAPPPPEPGPLPAAAPTGGVSTTTWVVGVIVVAVIILGLVVLA
ncbi:MAG: carbon monoxide dehydrogenase subunit G [Alphaproteobacteria bacterium]